MTARPEVYVEGVAIEIGWADARRNLGEFIFDTVRGAVDDSGRAMEEIDSVVLGAHDLVDARSLSSMVTAPAAGAYLRDEIRYGDDGAGALASAITRLESGENRRSIVAAWGRASEIDPEAFSRSMFDPWFGQPLGLDEITVSALRAQRWLRTHGTPAHREDAVARRRRLAADSPRARRSTGDARRPAPHPLTAEELPVWADVSVALVISTDPSPLRIAGMGQSSEPYFVGDRDLLAMPALQQAVDRALTGTGHAVRELDVYELDGLTAFDEALAFEAAGVAAAGAGWEHLAQDDRCNASGGSAAGYCAPAMGLARVAEAALRLRAPGGARTALATGSSAVASQTQTAILLETA